MEDVEHQDTYFMQCISIRMTGLFCDLGNLHFWPQLGCMHMLQLHISVVFSDPVLMI